MNKQRLKFSVLNYCVILTAILLLITSINGILSFSTGRHYQVTNQYGKVVNMYGAGLYAHDSLFKASIFIGTDFSILLFVLPLLIAASLRNRNGISIKAEINILSIFGIILYYAASISFGVTYNYLQLAYIALMGISFYTFFYLIFDLYFRGATAVQPLCTYTVTKGMDIFLACSGISIFIAWLPDIISSLAANRSLSLIEVYTTEITYVIDMSIISPLVFIVLYLLHKNSFIGLALFHMLLRIFQFTGVMLPLQTICQILMGIQIPLPALLTKIFIFIMLAVFARYFDISIGKKTIFTDG